MLDHRFFRHVATTPMPPPLMQGGGGRYVLESYKAVYARSTMVLFSRKTHTPLAALTFRDKNEDDIGCLSMLTARPGPPNNNNNTNNNATQQQPLPHFQGMLSLPDQAFSFTISNLSNDGMINFNILHTPNHNVSTVNPGPTYGINQVNELRPNQSYTIEADQRTHRRMVLAGKTKCDPSSGNQPTAVTVRESELETADINQKGLYFYLSVVADRACPSLVQKFQEGTVWQVVPGFIRRIPSHNNRNNNDDEEEDFDDWGYYYLQRRRRRHSWRDDDDDDDDDAMEDGAVAAGAENCSAEQRGRDDGNNSGDAMSSSPYVRVRTVAVDCNATTNHETINNNSASVMMVENSFIDPFGFDRVPLYSHPVVRTTIDVTAAATTTTASTSLTEKINNSASVIMVQNNSFIDPFGFDRVPLYLPVVHTTMDVTATTTTTTSTSPTCSSNKEDENVQRLASGGGSSKWRAFRTISGVGRQPKAVVKKPETCPYSAGNTGQQMKRVPRLLNRHSVLRRPFCPVWKNTFRCTWPTYKRSQGEEKEEDNEDGIEEEITQRKPESKLDDDDDGGKRFGNAGKDGDKVTHRFRDRDESTHESKSIEEDDGGEHGWRNNSESEEDCEIEEGRRHLGGNYEIEGGGKNGWRNDSENKEDEREYYDDDAGLAKVDDSFRCRRGGWTDDVVEDDGAVSEADDDDYDRGAANDCDDSGSYDDDKGDAAVEGSYDSDDDTEDEEVRRRVGRSPSWSAPLRFGSASSKYSPDAVVPIDVGCTQAGELRYGDHVQVHSRYTGHEYDYENPSEPTVLCLSIWQDMKFLPLADIEKDLSSQVQYLIDNPYVYLINEIKEVYKTDHCVIDLESEADTVICSCGHQCINHANVSASLRNCPLCRSAITAFIRADGMKMP